MAIVADLVPTGTLTFLEVLRSEVARMQSLHPERLGELARAHALILHGQVLPRADDPQTGQVPSSDGEKRYTVNGVCDCQAGQHGKGCKHMQAPQRGDGLTQLQELLFRVAHQFHRRSVCLCPRH